MINRETLGRGVFLVGASSVVSLGVLFGETVLVARALDPGSYGEYVLLLTVVNFLVLALDFGWKTAVIRVVASSDTERQRAVMNAALTFRLGTVLVASLLVLGVQRLLLAFEVDGTLPHLLGYAPVMLAFAAFDDLLLALLQGFRCYRNMAVAQVLRAGLRLSLTALFVVALGFGLTGLIWSWSISFAVSAAYQYVHLPFPPARAWSPSLIKEMLGFGWPLYLTGYLWFGSTRVHVLLLATLAGPTSVGLYAAAARIPEALQNIADAYVRVYFPTVTNLLAKGQRQAACAMLDSSVRLVAFASALAALTAVVFQREITTLLFSAKYAAASPVFALLMLALNLTAVVNLMGYTLTAAGHPRDSLVVDVVRAAGNTIGDLALIPLLGVVGAAAAAVVAGGAGVPGALWSLRLRGLPAASIWPAARQLLVLWGCAALWWFVQPESFLYKAAIVLLFLGLNTRTRSLVREDVAMVVPSRLLPRRSASV